MFHWATQIPGDIENFVKTSFKKESLPMTGVVLGSTVLLIVLDQSILESTQQFVENIHLFAESKQDKLVNFSLCKTGSSLPLPVFFPKNLNASMYFLVDGFTHITLIAGF